MAEINREVTLCFFIKNNNIGMIKHTIRHKDGSKWATVSMIDGIQQGHWEWFRKDGTKKPRSIIARLISYWI